MYTPAERTSRVTGTVKDFIKRLSITLHKREFKGEEPILVLDFLTRFVREEDMLVMSEVQAYLTLPYFVKGSAEDQFQFVCGSSRASEGGVTCCPKAGHYLLRSYATPNAIQAALLTLRDTRQRPMESETEYSTRFNKAFHRCSSAHSSQKKCNMFFDRLDPSVRALVARNREENCRRQCMDLVYYAQVEGDTLRARRNQRTRTSRALLADSSDSSLSLF